MGEKILSNISFDQLFEKDELPRSAKRIQIQIPVIIETKGQPIRANLVDISTTTMRIDRQVSMVNQEPCRVVISGQMPVELICMPIVDGRAFVIGSWNRLAIKTNFDIEKLISILKASAS